MYFIIMCEYSLRNLAETMTYCLDYTFKLGRISIFLQNRFFHGMKKSFIYFYGFPFTVFILLL